MLSSFPSQVRSSSRIGPIPVPKIGVDIGSDTETQSRAHL